MSKSHCSLAYHILPLDDVPSFSIGVKAGYFGNNPPFTVLPFTELAFEGLITSYINTRAAYVNGGEEQKAYFLLAKVALMGALDILAEETDKIADGDVPTIELGGFDATKTGSSDGEIPGQCVVTVKRGIAGELISSCAPVPGAKHYGCIVTQGGPLPDQISLNAAGKLIFAMGDSPLPGPGPQITGLVIDLTDKREKHFQGLIHDNIYFFYYYAVNAMGVGPLSEPVNMVCW